MGFVIVSHKSDLPRGVGVPATPSHVIQELLGRGDVGGVCEHEHWAVELFTDGAIDGDALDVLGVDGAMDGIVLFHPGGRTGSPNLKGAFVHVGDWLVSLTQSLKVQRELYSLSHQSELTAVTLSVGSPRLQVLDLVLLIDSHQLIP